MSQFKKSSNVNITKKLAKENTVFIYTDIVYFIQAKVFFLFETQKKMLQRMVEYLININDQHLILFSDVACLLVFFF